MVGANRKVKKVEAADYGLAKPVAYQPIQPNDPHLYSGLGKIQGNAAIVLHKVDFIAATLRHSDPITNTDWNAVAADIGGEGETAEDVKRTFKIFAIQNNFEKGDYADEPCVAGPSRAPGGGSVQNKAANTTATPSKRAGPAPKKSAAGVKKATGKIGAKAATAPKGKGKEKAVVEDTFTDDAMDIDEDEYEPAQPKATAKAKGKEKAVAPPEYSDVSDEWIDGM